MSAFVVDDETINRVIVYLASSPLASELKTDSMRNVGFDITTPIGRSNLGKAMFRLNCIAVDQRYGKDECKSFRPMDYRYRSEWSTPMQAFKSLRCWLYQCSEGDIPDTSALFKLMDRISEDMAIMLVKQKWPLMNYGRELMVKMVREIPEYNTACWG